MPLRIREACLSLVFFGYLAIPCASAQTWRAIGPPGGDARALAVDPSHPGKVYLGTTDGHIFGSSDGGEHWERLGRAGSKADAVVTSILIHPRNAAMLFASEWAPEPDGEGGGVFVSRDAGWSWRESGLAGHAVRALVSAPSDPDTLVAGALDGVFRSLDAGRTWEQITPAGDLELRNFDSLAIDPRNPEIIYAGTFHLPWKTVDGGQHWFPIHEGMMDDSDVLSLAVDIADPNRIFASACSGIYLSIDAGLHWKKVQGIPYSSRRTPVIRLDPSDPATIYAGTTEGLWKTVDDGVAWQRISPGDWVVNSLVIEPRSGLAGSPARLLAGTEQDGVLASDDGGRHFRESNDGFHHRRIISLAVDPASPGHIAAVLANARDAVVASEDGGRTWSPLRSGLEGGRVRRIFSSPSGWVAALACGGLSRWESPKRAWLRVGELVEAAEGEPRSSSRRTRSARKPFGAVVNDLVFGDEEWFAGTAEGLYVSRDDGDSWSALRFAPLPLPVNSVRVSRNGRRLRVASSRGMIFSDDAGTTWQWHDLPFESGGAKRLEVADERTGVAISNMGLYISRDLGLSWHRAQSGLPAAAVEDILVRPGRWVVSIEAGGLFESLDEGESWSRLRITSEFDNLGEHGRIRGFAEEEATGVIYVVSATDGLHILDLARNPTVAGQLGSGR